MTSKTRWVIGLLAVGALVVAGCKKEASSQEIELPEGQIHIATQWVSGALWVESFDPKSMTCYFSEYKNGRAVESSTITFTNCRTGLGGPVMRPLPRGADGRPAITRPGGMNPRTDMGRSGMGRPVMSMPGQQPVVPNSEAAPVAPSP